MKLQRFEVSDAPHLTVKICQGDLDVSGGRRGEVAIKAYGGEEDLQVSKEGEHLTIEVKARCKIGCPHGTTLTVENTQGGLRVREVDGPIAAKTVQGDLVLKEVGPTTVTTVQGDVRVRGVRGELNLEGVYGDVSARGVEGLLSAKNVAGDLNAAGLEGGLDATVAGDANLKTDFTAGCTYTLTTGGDVTLRFPEGASASIQATASNDLRHNVDWVTVTEGDGMISGTVGDGEAQVDITAGGDAALRGAGTGKEAFISISIGDDMDLELGQFESMAEEIERSLEEQMARMGEKLEEKLSRIDHDAIRLKAEQAAEKVRRQAERIAERARMRAERSRRQWKRMGGQPPTAPKRPSPPKAKADPVSDQERIMILRMVQEGKITAEEAAKLLKAMGA
jgi:hypothetical protein